MAMPRITEMLRNIHVCAASSHLHIQALLYSMYFFPPEVFTPSFLATVGL